MLIIFAVVHVSGDGWPACNAVTRGCSIDCSVAGVYEEGK